MKRILLVSMAASAWFAFGPLWASAGDAGAGAALAVSCVGCHGPRGEGVGPYPPLAGMAPQVFIEAMQAFRSGKQPSPAMGGLSKGLSDAQLADLAAFYAGLPAGEIASKPFAGPLHQVSALACKSCHEKTFEEWSESMHAKSTALSDPIHEFMYRREVGDPRQEGVLHQASGRYPVCLACHAPNAAKDKTTKLDAMAAYSEGVNCLACHQLAGFKGVRHEGGLRLGLSAYDTADQLQGPQGFPQNTVLPAGPERGNPHVPSLGSDGVAVPALMPLQGNPRLLKSSDICMGCHHLRPNPKGVPLCATGDEITQSGSKVSCQSCHMPIVDGKASHAMGGGHDAAMLSRALQLVVDIRAEPFKTFADVVLENRVPHKLPTGAPFRNAQVKVVALDANGAVLWENYKTHPGKESPEAYLHYQLVDDADKPAMPPVATKVGKDTRLQPHERRVLSYEVPPGTAIVRAEVLYNLVFEPMKEGIAPLTRDPDLLKPKRVAFYEAKL